mmetsp:Transcript_111082/g.192638  ORF Transcript_111082/g.192638 Transcript_111082/m.192638 type:complete len:91 (-) Transcript_111082:755-1027(-)
MGCICFVGFLACCLAPSGSWLGKMEFSQLLSILDLELVQNVRLCEIVVYHFLVYLNCYLEVGQGQMHAYRQWKRDSASVSPVAVKAVKAS